MKKFLFGMFLIGYLNLIFGCDFNFGSVPPTIVSYDVGLGFYEPCCSDIVYYYKIKIND